MNVQNYAVRFCPILKETRVSYWWLYDVNFFFHGTVIIRKSPNFSRVFFVHFFSLLSFSFPTGYTVSFPFFDKYRYSLMFTRFLGFGKKLFFVFHGLSRSAVPYVFIILQCVNLDWENFYNNFSDGPDLFRAALSNPVNLLCLSWDAHGKCMATFSSVLSKI